MPFFRTNIKHILVLVLPIYFFIGYASIINKHTHFYANGIIITHSHPVKKTNNPDFPINQHNHTTSKICFYYPSQSDKFIIPQTIQIDYEPVESQNKYLIVNENQESIAKLRLIPPRSPPA